ncbi:MAG: translation initiation factor IF-2 [Bryobacteraceae bacterium]|nr:translation initiation factor IF-2 [Bryobacteraceae bacterium]
MKKIRINELARELEVKPNKILELLPELGVSEKKTHSSSIDEDVAEHIKQHFGVHGNGDEPARAETSQEKTVPAAAEEQAQKKEKQEEKVEAAPKIEAAPKQEPPAAAKEKEEEKRASEQPSSAPAVEVVPPSRPAVPVRPTLLGGHGPLQPPIAAPGSRQPAAPPAPVRPPAAQIAPGPAGGPSTVVKPPVARPQAPAQPQQLSTPVQTQQPQQRATPAQPQTPAAKPVAPAAPQQPRPAAPRPGQILTGPRQPLPGGPISPPTIVVPGTPRTIQPGQPIVRPQPPRPAVQPAQQEQQPSAGGAQQPGQPRPQTPQQPQQAQPARPLAGQPVARPVVPPRPDLVARLTQTQPKAMPGQPQARPAMPGRPQQQNAPVPGQPIYRGPIRPGQPLMRGPGAPGTAAPGRTGRPRPMHPTSPLRVEPAAPPPTETRRHQGKQAARAIEQRDREMELEGKVRYPVSRRTEPAAPPPIDREITIAEGLTVKELSEKLGVKANLVIKKLVERKIFATINQTLDVKLAQEIARQFGASTNQVSYEEEATQEIELAEDPKDLVKRAPVVTIMGHVDHGKTSLLDAIRQSRVAEKEAGGITQHIGAYQVEKNDRKIVFIDTPGHEAFTRMRARGAKVTDIVVLVVAADDGVMPQTLEAIDHAKAAKVPIIVAINKIDKPEAQPERIKQQLSERGLLAEEWGGDTVMVPVSAKAKQNLDLLLEMILLVADLQDLKANPNRPAVGTVLEAQLDRGRGPVATVLVRNGTLRVGDYFICGSVFGKVRAMFDDRGNQVREAEPSMPVEVLGLDSLPEVGDTFQVVTDTAKAKQIVIYREAKAREISMAKTGRITLDQLHGQLKEGEVKELNIILKTDVGGTAEVLSDTLQKLSNEKVRIRVLHAGVGAITESDVLLASASNAIIIGFNVRAERSAVTTAEQEKVEIRFHTIIYELTEEIKKAMTGMLEPVFKEVYRGRAEVREVFRISKVGMVAGCMVVDGLLTRDSQVRLLRDNIVIHTGKIESLKRFKNDVSEVKSGFECGVAIANFNDLKPGDIIEAFVTERVAAEALV